MVDQQNSWNSLVISIYLLYLERNVGMLAVNICILWPSLEQKIAALEEHVTELHLAVYDQHDYFVVLREATTSKLKRFAKALGDPSLYNAPSP
jgi:hypothetical protein